MTNTEQSVGLDGGMDAKVLDYVVGLSGALSRTQTSQLGAKDGFELRLWVSS
ncbi:hypothetical protein BH10ACT11_BH10ACT11_15350 [soil metagenome]